MFEKFFTFKVSGKEDLSDTDAGKFLRKEIENTKKENNPFSSLFKIQQILVEKNFAALSPEMRTVAMMEIGASTLMYVSKAFPLFLVHGTVHTSSDYAWNTIRTSLDSLIDGQKRTLKILETKKISDISPAFFIQCIRALTELKKLLRMHYKKADEKWWGHLVYALKITKMYKMEDKVDFSFENDWFKMSPLLQLKLAALFETLPLDAMSSSQMAAAEAILYKVAPVMDKEPEVVSYYWKEESTHGLTRVLAGMIVPQGAMKLGYSQLRMALAPLKLTFSHNLPDWILGTGCNFSECQRLLSLFSAHWSDAPPERRHVRETKEAILRGVHGFRNVSRMICHSIVARRGVKVPDGYFDDLGKHAFSMEASFSLSGSSPQNVLEQIEKNDKDASIEQWKLRDISESGVGVSTSSSILDTQIGNVVAFRHDNDVLWRLGIVRRLEDSTYKDGFHGIEFVSGESHYAELWPLDKDGFAFIPTAKKLEQEIETEEDDQLSFQIPGSSQKSIKKEIVSKPVSKSVFDIVENGKIGAIMIDNGSREILIPKGTFKANLVVKMVMEKQIKNLIFRQIKPDCEHLNFDWVVYDIHN